METRLRDGTPAFIWPLLQNDVAGLRDAFGHLSAEARRQRFLNGLNELSEAMISQLVRSVDGVHHIALVLVAVPPDADDQPVGIARLVPDRSDPTVAHLACTVADGWRRRGVGAALTAALLARRPPEVRYIKADVAEGNAASLALVRSIGPVSVLSVGGGVLELLVDLERAEARSE